ncbi:Os08g0280125 [Oryza sativa Japonica Group]|uniref:Os08g0280125 protein n=1 Tax=Oryza sativa subsp. japonica TaxID=39947 RepID=A0A0P0XE70_ORYSJ|nr:Os08g0280125 [Oryza sativa Japonica Group]
MDAPGIERVVELGVRARLLGWNGESCQVGCKGHRSTLSLWFDLMVPFDHHHWDPRSERLHEPESIQIHPIAVGRIPGAARRGRSRRSRGRLCRRWCGTGWRRSCRRPRPPATGRCGRGVRRWTSSCRSAPGPPPPPPGEGTPRRRRRGASRRIARR